MIAKDYWQGIHSIFEQWFKGISKGISKPRYSLNKSSKTQSRRWKRFVKDPKDYAYAKNQNYNRFLPREKPLRHWLKKMNGLR